MHIFERHKAQKAAEAHQDEVARWQHERDGYAHLLALAKSFDGTTDTSIMLGPGEAVFYTITGASLVEDRRGRGTWQGASQGISIPIGSVHGRSVRYRVGTSRGHYVQGAPVATAIDTGTVYITNQRVIFQGAKQTRECLYAKLIGFTHDDHEGSTTFSVSNRQKPTTLHYGPALSAAFDFRLDLALAHSRGDVADLVAKLERELSDIESREPDSPSATPG